MKRKIYIIIYFIIMGIIIFTSNDISVFKTELEYVACGNAGGIPKVIPQLTSTLYSILMFAVPIALILFGVITLIKAIISTNADEIAKARGKLAKKFMMAAIAFAVIFITATIFNMLANGRDANDKPSISQCMSCFLSYSDNHCYKSDSENDVHKGSSYEPYSGEKIETHPETSASSGTGLAALFAAAKKADQLTYSRGYSYGHSSAWNGTDYPNKLVACDRGVGLTLYFFGYTDVNPTELTLTGLNIYLPKWGWEKITNFDDIQPGDIVFYDRGHKGYMSSKDHVFLVGETIGQRYDWGSTRRIQHQDQYSGGMPFTEGISRSEFGWAYRMPASKRNEKTDTSSSTSSSGNTQASSFYALGDKAFNGDAQAKQEWFDKVGALVKKANHYGMKNSLIMIQIAQESGWMRTPKATSSGTTLVGSNNVIGINYDMGKPISSQDSRWSKNPKYINTSVSVYDSNNKITYEVQKMRAYDSLEDCIEDYANLMYIYHPECKGNNNMSCYRSFLNGYTERPADQETTADFYTRMIKQYNLDKYDN